MGDLKPFLDVVVLGWLGHALRLDVLALGEGAVGLGGLLVFGRRMVALTIPGRLRF